MDARWPSAVYFQPSNGASVISPAGAVPHAGSKYALLNNTSSAHRNRNEFVSTEPQAAVASSGEFSIYFVSLKHK